MDFDLSDAQSELQICARALAKTRIAARAAEIDDSREYPWDNVAALTEAGFMGMTIPVEYVGPGLGYLDAVLVIEEMARVCAVTGRIAVEANLGALAAVLTYGTEAQKRQWAEAVLSGDKPAICITEPGAGSAASEMTTRAERRGNGYVINGGKHWITGGGISRMHLIFARVFDERGDEDDNQDGKIVDEIASAEKPGDKRDEGDMCCDKADGENLAAIRLGPGDPLHQHIKPHQSPFRQ